MELKYTLVLHYGGVFESINNVTTYVGGNVEEYDNVDPYVWSFCDLEDLLGSLGCDPQISKAYYKMPNYLDRFQKIKSEFDVINMFVKLDGSIENPKIDIYIVAPERVEVNEIEQLDEGNDMPLESPVDETEVDQTYLDFAEVESSYSPDDELRSLCGLDEETGGTGGLFGINNQDFIVNRDLGVKTLELGMRFASAADFRLALKDYVVKEKMDIKFDKNESNRVTAICKDRCGWRVHASHSKHEQCFKIKMFNPEHKNCLWFHTNNQVTYTYLANRYLEQIRLNPNMSCSALRSTIASDLDIDVSIFKVYRTKRLALRIIQGDAGEQYAKLRDYCELILKTNPGSRATISVDPVSYDSEVKIFQRVFICYAAMRKGFLEGCRPFIGVDGCFLKGTFGGQLLSAVAVDGNNQLFPVAFGVVEAENIDSWRWFMSELMECIGPHYHLTFISDRQKGLVGVFENILYGAEHRFCVRHLYENFKQKFKGQALKNELWEAALSFTETDLTLHMNRIKDLSIEAYNWLKRVDPRVWTRAHFSHNSKTPLVINNMCESWNAVILEARDKPIIYMLEWIRKYLMLRLQKKRESMISKDVLLCPNIQRELNMRKKGARFCRVRYAGYDKYDVECNGASEAVDVNHNSCSCLVWNVTGIPCKHAVACFFERKENAEIYVDNYYLKETYLKAYGGIIYPIPMRGLLLQDPTDPLMPPNYRVPAGRPPKARKKQADENVSKTKLSRQREEMQCSKCKVYGHNKRTCKATEAIVVEKPPPKKKGRPVSTIKVLTRARRGGRGGICQGRGNGIQIREPTMLGRGSGNQRRGGKQQDKGKGKQKVADRDECGRQSQEVISLLSNRDGVGITRASHAQIRESQQTQNISFTELLNTQASSSRSMVWDNDYAAF